MPANAPKLVAINHDGDDASHVGRTADGRQFFLTRPFEPAVGGKEGREFVALYIFDAMGKLIEAKIDDLGPREAMDEAEDQRIRALRMKELGNVSFGRIEVAPFVVERFGCIFGLVPRAPEGEEEPWAVEAQPGNYMAFFEPWDSGEYDT